MTLIPSTVCSSTVATLSPPILSIAEVAPVAMSMTLSSNCLIDLAELVDAVSSDEYPSSGRRHAHRHPSVLAGDLDALYEAYLGIDGMPVGHLPRASYIVPKVVMLS